MKTRFAVLLSLLLCFAMAAFGTSRSPLTTNEMKFVYMGRTYLGDQGLIDNGKDASSPEDFTFTVSCMFDTGGVDVGFAIDSTGSMGSTLTAVKATIGSFATGLDTAGYDARYGACPFGDSTSGMWDFNPSTPHPTYEMTDDIVTFQSKLALCGPWGGGDTPEDYLSSLVALMRYYDWRPLSMKIIIGFIDAVFCEIGDACFDCRSHNTKEDVLDELLDGGFILFNVTRDPPMWGSGVPAAPYHINWYQSSAAATGGHWYSFTTPWTTIFNDVIAFIRDYQSISVAVTNNSSSTIYDVTGELIAGPCFELITAPEPRDSILPGATVVFSWRFEPFDPVTCPIDSTNDFCFLTVFHSTDGIAPLPDFVTGGCVFFGEDCGCNGTIAEKQFPPDYAITSCPDQFVRYSMSSKCYMDEESFIFKVNSGAGWVMYPWGGEGLTMLSDTGFIWAPEDTLLFFGHGDTVRHELYQITDVAGLGLNEMPSGVFIVDLEPPVFEMPYPSDGILIGGPPANVRIDVFDDISGVDPDDGWWMTINGVEIPTSDPNLTFDGSRINLAVTGAITAMFPSGDTIEVCVGAQDSPDLCSPNQSSTCWSFIIDYLDFDLPEMTVEPNDTFLLPIITINPNRFNIRNFDVSFTYNPEILGFIGAVRAGSALPASWTVGMNASDGIATVWGSGTGALSAIDTLVFLRAYVKPTAPSASFTPLIYIEDGIVVDSGYVGYRIIDNGWVLVGWSPETWVHDLTFDSDIRPINTILTFGIQPMATDGYDLGIDIPFYPPPSNRTNTFFTLNDDAYPLVTKLERDLRGPAPLPITWKISTVGDPGTLTWSTIGLPEGILTLNGMLEMHHHSSYRYAANETLTIVYDRPDPAIDEIQLGLGWNLVGFPCVPTVDVVPDIFPSGLFNIYGYNPSTWSYFITNRAEAGRGYWVYSTEAGNNFVGGIPVPSYQVPLSVGWNLVGCANIESATYSSTPSLAGPMWTWNPATETYVEATTIDAGKGYWVLVSSPGNFRVPGDGSAKVDQPKWVADFEFAEANYTIGVGPIEHSKGIPPAGPNGEMRIPGALMMDGFKMWGLVQPDADSWTFIAQETGILTWGITETPAVQIVVNGVKTELLPGTQVFLNKGDVATFSLISKLPAAYAVMVRPNPANAAFTVTVDLPDDSEISVELFDMLGRQVERIAEGKMTAGTHRFGWQSTTEPSGVYFVRVKWDGGDVMQKVVLLK